MATIYGVDKVSVDSNAYTSGSWESLIFDNGNPLKEKLALKLVVEFTALAAGETVAPKFKFDRASSWTAGTAEDTDGATRVEYVFGRDARFKEIEFGFNLVSSTTFPIIKAVMFIFDDLREELSDR